jgi:coatomer subunit beta'
MKHRYIFLLFRDLLKGNSLNLIKTVVKTFEVTELPIRAAKFIPRKNWVVAGSDDMHVRVFNYNTHEKVIAFEAHQDYIRTIAVHHTQPFLLTGSDDMTIKLWDWEKGWKNIMTFEGHTLCYASRL